jgi:membrane-associated phospholipid phosphatase
MNMVSVHRHLQRAVERAFFGGKSTGWSTTLSYWIGNVTVLFAGYFILSQLVLYRWTGGLYAEGEGFRLDFLFGGIDNAIPFVPWMALFYVYLYYPMLVFTAVYFSFIECRRGYALGFSLLLVGILANIVYIFFPVSVYWWRQEILANPPEVFNLWVHTMFRYYERDTSFNCFPSLHAATTAVVVYVWYRFCRLKPGLWRRALALLVCAIGAGIIVSTLFVRQHYIADELAGIVVALVVSQLVFRYLWR